MKITAAELEMLTPEERAGVNDTDDVETGAPAAELEDMSEAERTEAAEEAARAAAEAKIEKDAGVTGDDDGDAEPAAKVAKAPAVEPPAATDEDDETGPVIVAPRLPEAAARDYKAEKAELRKQYDEGDLSQDEYDDKRDALSQAEASANLRADLNRATADAKWEAEMGIFFGQYPQFTEKPGLKAALDAHVAAIDVETKHTLSGYALLQRARKAVNAELGLVPAATDDAPAGDKPASKTRPVPTADEATRRAMARAPKTLADVPSAEDSDAGQSKWAQLDALADKGGMEYEQALARLSAADYAEYGASRDITAR